MPGQKNGPKQSLAKQVATIKQLREMDAATERKQTCGTCQITYTSESAARECRTWHRTGR